MKWIVLQRVHVKTSIHKEPRSSRDLNGTEEIYKSWRDNSLSLMLVDPLVKEIITNKFLEYNAAKMKGLHLIDVSDVHTTSSKTQMTQLNVLKDAKRGKN